MIWLAGILVAATGLWLMGLALTVVFAPGRAERFLLGFASSAKAHYSEQIVRLIAGWAILTYAPQTAFPRLLTIFGWLIVVTSAGLMLVPWRWHHRFGEWAIPLAIRFIKLYAFGAFALGAFILYAAWPR